ncbi:MAG: hypothetical protein Greene041662_328 [Candidatus Peregrinibacteria bacterium Greene0416_62]|nr:MAG: hypothetical protein Greene041662_328 [Candidatus Peregrinibacteria bacterium Greene0416_62]TSC97662.1 MAG: hypothetical protein Greene101449_1128 [Candidatus Peregrinibacteria bacterium Greene1014_49]
MTHEPIEVPKLKDTPDVRKDFSPLVDTATTTGELEQLMQRSVLSEQADSRHNNLERRQDHRGL